MWPQSMGPFAPAVVTGHREIHNICHLLTLSCTTDLFLMRRLLSTHVEQCSWKLEATDGSHGLPGAAALTVDNPSWLAQGPGSTDPPAALTLSSVVHLSRFKVPPCTVRECLTSQCRLENQVKADFFSSQSGSISA